MDHIWVASPHANLSERVSVVWLISVLLWRFYLFMCSVDIWLMHSWERPRPPLNNYLMFTLWNVLAVIALNGLLCLNLAEWDLLVEYLEKGLSLHNQFILVTNLLKETVTVFKAVVGLAGLDDMGESRKCHTGWFQAPAYVIVKPNEVHPRYAVLH